MQTNKQIPEGRRSNNLARYLPCLRPNVSPEGKPSVFRHRDIRSSFHQAHCRSNQTDDQTNRSNDRLDKSSQSPAEARTTSNNKLSFAEITQDPTESNCLRRDDPNPEINLIQHKHWNNAVFTALWSSIRPVSCVVVKRRMTPPSELDSKLQTPRVAPQYPLLVVHLGSPPKRRPKQTRRFNGVCHHLHYRPASEDIRQRYVPMLG